jgi:hypothetical protein
LVKFGRGVMEGLPFHGFNVATCSHSCQMLLWSKDGVQFVVFIARGLD